MFKTRCYENIAFPAKGKGGFFLALYDCLTKNKDLNKKEKDFLKYHTFYRNEK